MSDLVLEEVGKTYGGHRALRDVTTRFVSGRISAVLGPNGAGKTTLLGILSTLVAPTKGWLRWGDERLSRSSLARSAIGYVGHDPGLYGDLDARENLALFAALHGAPRGREDEMLARVGLATAPADAPVRTFSRGMLQRLALARALIHSPALLLFDEPSAALDPAGADWLQGELRAERAAGRIVVLVTHDLEAAGDVADHLLILRRGRVVFDETRPGAFSVAVVRALYREHTRG